MKVLVDTSVLLRKLFAEPDQLREWRQIREAYASRLLAVEAERVIHRVRLAGEIDDREVELLQRELRRALRSITVLALTDRVLGRAAGPMPTVLGTLDAIHLATALELAQGLPAPGPVVLATHDQQLARAARASGLEVWGS